MLLSLVGSAMAVTPTELDSRIYRLNGMFEDMQQKSDKRIPADLLRRAQGIILLDRTKAGFLFAFQGGVGVAMTKDPTTHQWSAPAFIRIAGGSFGFQIGGQATDLVLVAVNDKGFQDLLKSKFKIGGDASAAAGPVGRDSQAATDWKLNAELLTYSRAKGLFAGIDLTGAVVDENVDATRAFYGVAHPSAQILKGEVATPPDARPFVRTVAKYFTDVQSSK